MKIHELKTDPEVYDAVCNGEKSFEIRFDDRNFKVGDRLILKKTIHTGEEMNMGKPLNYIGVEKAVEVLYILRGQIYGLMDGWVIMSIQDED